ncbi:MAG: hypothetical protein K8S98_07620 [Planctomycetes bacterium]|nr:hypothetical protein [Planctomycetota bacterium]
MGSNGARWLLRIWIAVGVALMATAVLVRGIGNDDGGRTRPEATAPTIPEPMQLLSRAGRSRIDERWLWIEPEHRDRWERCYKRPFEIADCPRFGDWIATRAGADTALLVSELTRGKAEEAVTALALVFELARRTAWRAGVLDSGSDATQLAALLENWLALWAATSARDPLLAEPTRAAFCLWGRVTSTAIDAPLFGRDAAVASHARVFVESLIHTKGAAPTDFGRAFGERYPRAFTGLLAEDDFLVGLADDCTRLFPELDGGCGS